MKLLKKIGLGLLALLVLLALISFLLPKQIHVERTALIQAPDSVLFAQVNTMKNWSNWSPWHQIDPQHTQYTFGDKPAGEGAWYSWTSTNSSVGSGKLTVTKSVPSETIEAALDFGDQGTAKSAYYFKSEGNATRVTFTMDSDMSQPPVIGPYFGLLMDGWIGNDYEKGLENLAKVAKR